MKKCCLNCAFCIRCQDTQISMPGYADNKKKIGLLNDEERKQAEHNDYSFIGAKKKTQEQWKKKYNELWDRMKKGEFNDRLGNAQTLEWLTIASSSHPATYPLAQLFGIGDCPDAPDADYLSCWHNLWNFKGKEKELPTLCKKNKCLFFYPYDRKGNKSFEGCEKEREALLAKSRFMTTNWLVILGIFVTILIFAIQTWNNRQTIQTQEVVTTKENTQQTITPKTQNKNSQPSESELR